MIRLQKIPKFGAIFGRPKCGGSAVGAVGQRRLVCKLSKECGPSARHQYMDPQCKVALITGGATGIGLAIAHELLESQLYRVIISGADPCAGQVAARQLNETHGKDKACFVHLNVTCSKQFEDVFREVKDKFGGLDILVNNAGIMMDKKWEYEIDVNMASVVRGTMIAMKCMQENKRKGGLVINIADSLAFESFPYAPIYTGTKYGVLGLSRSFGDSFHYNRTGVRVVALCPGSTDSAMVKDADGNQLDKSWGKEAVAQLLAKPMQKTAAVGKAAVYLVQYAPPGSVWVVEDSQLYRATIPKRTTYLEKVTQL